MATKLTVWCKKFGAVVFTSLVAPVLVNLAVRDVPDEAEQAPSRQHEALWQGYPSIAGPTPFSHVEPQPPQQTPSPFAATARPMKIVRVIARGVGRTPEAALQDALDAALRQAVASEVDALTGSQNGPALCAGILPGSEDIIISWRNLGERKERSWKGAFYREDVAVEVNLNALVDRLWIGPASG